MTSDHLLLPLDAAKQQWSHNLNAVLKSRLNAGMRALREYHERSGKPFCITTMFTGSGIGDKLCTSILDEHRISNVVGFQCDNSPDVLEFLAVEFPDVPIRFTDAMSISQEKSKNVVSGKYTRIPCGDILMGGFVCKSRSKANLHSSSNKHCVRECREETGLTFSYVTSYIDSGRRPRLIILENVNDLAEGGDESDAMFIIKEFEKRQYCAHYHMVDAQPFGSFPRKVRMYFTAFDDCESDTNDVSFKNAFVHTLLQDNAFSEVYEFSLVMS
jgi:site-specific DNA-cytosine methylase